MRVVCLLTHDRRLPARHQLPDSRAYRVVIDSERINAKPFWAAAYRRVRGWRTKSTRSADDVVCVQGSGQ